LEGSTATDSVYVALFVEDKVSEEQMLYVQQLHLGLVKVNLSYFKGKRTGRNLTDASGFALFDVDDINFREFAVTAGGLQVGRRVSLQESHSEVFAQWSETTHDEDLWVDEGGGE
jgi:hypothetical protein